LFDFDGTLTRPGALDFSAIKREIQCPAGVAILEHLDGLPPPERTACLKILEQMEEEAARTSVPNAGAKKCLLFLKKEGIPFGILTRNSRASVRIALERFEWIRLEDFAAVITRDDSLPKPHPEGVFQAAVRMGIEPSELMVVGDYRFDVLAGKAANALTVLLGNGREPVMAPGDPEPDHKVDNLLQIMDLMGINAP
jgi:HAD superfamily hydrolase (TIGR01509 family)